MRKILFLFLASALAMSTVGCGGSSVPTPQQLMTANYGTYPTEYRDIIKRYMHGLLIDPYSAQYEFLKGPAQAWHNPWPIGDTIFGYAVCAGINSKNRFGGYVGMKPFFFMLHDGAVVHIENSEYVVGKACSSI